MAYLPLISKLAHTIWYKIGCGRNQGLVVEGCFSDSRPVIGSALQFICTNDLDYNVVNIVSKFAEATKVGGIMDNEERYPRAQ